MACVRYFPWSDEKHFKLSWAKQSKIAKKFSQKIFHTKTNEALIIFLLGLSLQTNTQNTRTLTKLKRTKDKMKLQDFNIKEKNIILPLPSC
jgi:hypothetical protein